MSEIEELREEVARLRKEVADLRAGSVVHHYHHRVMGETLPAPQPYSVPTAPYPGAPFPVVCETTRFISGGASGELPQWSGGHFGPHMTAARDGW